MCTDLYLNYLPRKSCFPLNLADEGRTYGRMDICNLGVASQLKVGRIWRERNKIEWKIYTPEK